MVSLFGDWFNFIAATELITHLSDSSLSISILVGIRTLAPVLGAPLVPFVVKRMRRRTVLILSDLLRCGSVLGLLLVKSPEDLWLLYALITLQGMLSGIFFPIRTTLLSVLVNNEKELGAANALSSLSWTGMIALGTALGGVVTAALGEAASFLIDAGTFLISALFLWNMRYEPTSESMRQRQAHHPSQRTDVTYRDLLALLWQRKDYLWLVLKKTLVTVFSFNPTQVLQILLSRRYPQVGPNAIVLGIIFAVGGCASFFSPIIVRFMTGNDHRRMRHALTIAYLVVTLGMIMQAPIPPFGLLLVGVALRSMGAVIVWTFSTQMLLSLTPLRLRDHMLSFEFFCFNLTGVLGVAMPALIAENERLGIGGAFNILGGSFLLISGAWAYWVWKGTYRIPVDERLQA